MGKKAETRLKRSPFYIDLEYVPKIHRLHLGEEIQVDKSIRFSKFKRVYYVNIMIGLLGGT